MVSNLSTTLSRLASLKKYSDISVRAPDEIATLFPLASYLHLVNHSADSCYTEYLEGAKRLYRWLSPLSIPPIPPSYQPPALLKSYYTWELSGVLTPDKDDLSARITMHNTIIYLIIQEAST